MQETCYCRSSQLYSKQTQQSYTIGDKKYSSKRILQKNHQINEKILQELQEANQLWLPSKINKVSIDQIMLNPLWFYKDYISKNIPVIIMNSLDGNDICERWSDQKYLQEALDGQKLSISLTPDGFADSIKGQHFIQPQEIKTGIKSFFNTKEQFPNSIAYVQHQNNNLSQELSGLQAEVPQQALLMLSQSLFDGKMPDAQNFWLGRRQSVSSLHKDPYQNFYTTIVGEKHFTLIPPCGILRMEQFSYKKAKWQYKQNKFNLIQDPDKQLTRWIACNPDLKTDQQLFPNLKNIPKYHVILEAQEMLYLPSLWYHQVSQQHPKNNYTLAINYWFDMSFTQNFSFYQLCRGIKGL